MEMKENRKQTKQNDPRVLKHRNNTKQIKTSTDETSTAKTGQKDRENEFLSYFLKRISQTNFSTPPNFRTFFFELSQKRIGWNHYALTGESPVTSKDPPLLTDTPT
jgi:hypothetical protein